MLAHWCDQQWSLCLTICPSGIEVKEKTISLLLLMTMEHASTPWYNYLYSSQVMTLAQSVICVHVLRIPISNATANILGEMCMSFRITPLCLCFSKYIMHNLWGCLINSCIMYLYNAWPCMTWLMCSIIIMPSSAPVCIWRLRHFALSWLLEPVIKCETPFLDSNEA